MKRLDIAGFCQEAAATEGWNVLSNGLNKAIELCGSRLVSAYAIGSLAHGGFAPAASDVDLVLIFDRADASAEASVRRIQDEIQTELKTPLARRLSVFWSSWNDLARRSGVGRFPLADQEDLIRHGLLVWGEDKRASMVLPEPAQMKAALVIESARFIIEKLAVPQKDALLREPARLIAHGVRDTTKAVLFPVRFLYTADVGRTAGNPESVAHFCRRHAGAASDLVSAAFEWRQSGALGSESSSLRQLSRGLLPVYRELTSTYQQALESYYQPSLAQEMIHWWKRIMER